VLLVHRAQTDHYVFEVGREIGPTNLNGGQCSGEFRRIPLLVKAPPAEREQNFVPPVIMTISGEVERAVHHVLEIHGGRLICSDVRTEEVRRNKLFNVGVAFASPLFATG
jgi:hypothetical protein